MIQNYGNKYLIHWGIKGQKWGIRRYQNPDGTLTPEGRKRYSSNVYSSIKNSSIKNANTINSLIRFKKDIKEQVLTDKKYEKISQLYTKLKNINLEKEYYEPGNKIYDKYYKEAVEKAVEDAKKHGYDIPDPDNKYYDYFIDPFFDFEKGEKEFKESNPNHKEWDKTYDEIQKEIKKVTKDIIDEKYYNRPVTGLNGNYNTTFGNKVEEIVDDAIFNLYDDLKY